MDARAEKLLSVFETSGWKISGSADVSSDWWFEDIIELTSLWHPVGTNIYLTLLIDPMCKRQEELWAIGVSFDIPSDQEHEFLDMLSLNDIKRTDLKSFVERINKLALHSK